MNKPASKNKETKKEPVILGKCEECGDRNLEVPLQKIGTEFFCPHCAKKINKQLEAEELEEKQGRRSGNRNFVNEEDL